MFAVILWARPYSDASSELEIHWALTSPLPPRFSCFPHQGPALPFSPTGSRQDVSRHFCFQHLTRHHWLFCWASAWTLKLGQFVYELCLRAGDDPPPPAAESCFYGEAGPWTGPSVLCKQEIKSRASVELEILGQQASSCWHCWLNRKQNPVMLLLLLLQASHHCCCS